MRYSTDKGYIDYTPDTQDMIGIDDDGYDMMSESYTMIDLVYVSPEYRKQGIARQMMTDFLTTMSGTIRLAALPKEKSIEVEDLVSFYESIGFMVDDEQCGDAVVMSMDI